MVLQTSHSVILDENSHIMGSVEPAKYEPKCSYKNVFITLSIRWMGMFTVMTVTVYT